MVSNQKMQSIVSIVSCVTALDVIPGSISFRLLTPGALVHIRYNDTTPLKTGNTASVKTLGNGTTADMEAIAVLQLQRQSQVEEQERHQAEQQHPEEHLEQ